MRLQWWPPYPRKLGALGETRTLNPKDMDLNHARIPIPPQVHILLDTFRCCLEWASFNKPYFTVKLSPVYRHPLLGTQAHRLSKTWCTLQESNLLHRIFSPLLWPHQLKVQLFGPHWWNRTTTPKFVASCNIHFTKRGNNWWRWQDLNPLPSECKSDALPGELHPQSF